MRRRWGIVLTVVYALAYGAAFAARNFGEGSGLTALFVALWLATPVVGFLVGRWWVVFAMVGVLLGHAIGWDAAENDGNPAFWPAYLIAYSVFIGGPLALGAAFAYLRRRRRRAADENRTRVISLEG